VKDLEGTARNVARFFHPRGICEASEVGDGTRIWAFAQVLAGARIGAECNICDNVFIENDVVVGDRVTVGSGVQLWDGCGSGTMSSSAPTRRSPTIRSPAARSTNTRSPSRAWKTERRSVRTPRSCPESPSGSAL